MDEADARRALEALIRDRREDYAGLSRLLGRNPAYIQQYVKRGTPRRLGETDRRRLARYFGVADADLGGPPEARVARAADGGKRREADLIAVPRFPLGASAGPGAVVEDEEERAGPGMRFTPAMLRALGVGRPAALSMIRVDGNSMLPTLSDGDEILVDGDDAADRLREGVYVLRLDDGLMVKRVAIGPDERIAVLSDNPTGPRWPSVDRATLRIVGRVVWAGGRMR